jgi:hypothetical protein
VRPQDACFLQPGTFSARTPSENAGNKDTGRTAVNLDAYARRLGPVAGDSGSAPLDLNKMKIAAFVQR